MVVVPTLLDQRRRASSELLEHLEVLALGNLDPHVHFAILERLHRRAGARDARTTRRSSPPRAAGIEALNARHGDGPQRPLLPVPSRAPVEPERRRRGWAGSASAARSRSSTGCCAAPRDTSFTVQVGDLDDPAARPLLHHARLRHPPAARRRAQARSASSRTRSTARTSIRALGRVTEGYGILQPRVSVTMASAAGSLFARLYAGPHRRRPLHHRGLGHLPGPVRRGHLHRQGALRRRRVHGRARRPRARERAALARPLRGPLRAHRARHRRRGGGRLSRERARARAAPAPLGARRLADPAAGSSRWCRRAHGLRAQPPAAHLRWKIFDNLRRSLVAPATWSLLLAGVDGPARAAPAAWTAGGRWRPRLPRSIRCSLRLLAGPRPAAAAGACSCARVREDLQTALRAGRCCTLTFLAYQACEMVARHRAHAGAPGCHAAAAARVGDRAAAGRARGRARRAQRRARCSSAEMAASPLIALVGSCSSPALRPAALPVAAARPRACGSAAPLVAYWLSRPVAARRARARRRGPRAPAPWSRARPGATSRRSWAPRTTGCRRQLPGGARAAASRTAPRPPTSAWACSPRSPRTTSASSAPASCVERLERDARRRSRASSATRATCSTGTTRRPWPRCCRATSRPWTAATSPAR